MSKPVGSVKTGGRKKGTPNKKTFDLGDALERHGLDVVEKLAGLLPQLTCEKQADTLLEMMGYLYPKRKAIEAVSQSVVIQENNNITNEEAEKKLEAAKKEAMSLAKKLVLLDQSTEEIYIRSKIEEELRTRRAQNIKLEPLA